MGRSRRDPDAYNELSLFSTPLGWMGILGRDGVVQSIQVGHPTAASVRAGVAPCQIPGRPLRERDWLPELRQALLDYAEGHPVDFGDVPLALPARTEFRDKVLAATRQLGYGQTTTYGDLARKVGHPGAARAVGTVMSTNRFPILIPCHRVLASGGKLGGYTSPAGTGLKQRLLDMEQAT